MRLAAAAGEDRFRVRLDGKRPLPFTTSGRDDMALAIVAALTGLCFAGAVAALAFGFSR